MGFRCGIIGLPNVGKSTIFNAMTSAGVQASNYPFCTIDPNVGVVPLRDQRLYKLAKLVEPERVVPTTVEFVDIAGLVRGASKGEGLGNQFLGHIRSVDALAHIVRCFEDPDVVHVDGEVDPIRDVDTINTELILSDLDSVEKRVDKLGKMAKCGDKAAAATHELAKRVIDELSAGRPARALDQEALESASMKELNLLTAKPVLYVVNVDEAGLGGDAPSVAEVRKIAAKEGGEVVVICGKVESEIAELPEEERESFLSDIGIAESGLDRMARGGYDLLGLITYFTVGKKEVRAWTVERGATAVDAAGVIHTDFAHGFIRAEVIAYDDFTTLGSEAACKEKGRMRLEGKEYIVNDGDLMHFRFNV
ncbi:MAG: redox-regulated ATPase YchF [Thermodesulfobacteriota bacterium]